MCQFVPSTEIDGCSLDLMRRRQDEALPNGVIDFVIVETILHMRRLGLRGLGLNFSVLRAVVSGERSDGSWRDIERRVLARLGDSAQIESLWRFNAKFHPEWQPRWSWSTRSSMWLHRASRSRTRNRSGSCLSSVGSSSAGPGGGQP